ncbi:glucose-1-phosphate thymidylyltransferase, partial [bacterium]|nr:glucose-1-phosphate thymidylyltransferase [bacterium]
GDGEAWGLKLDYREQPSPGGIAQAFLIAESFLGQDHVALILGDNIFYGGDSLERAFSEFSTGALVFAYHVRDPERYGVIEFDVMGNAVSIEEKPSNPRTNFAVPGLYLYDNQVVGIAKRLRPSARGELEITGVNADYMIRGQLKVRKLNRGFAWLDAGTSSSLHDSSSFIHTVETRQGIKLGCPEEAALHKGFINAKQLQACVERMPVCEYRKYLEEVMSNSAPGS